MIAAQISAPSGFSPRRIVVLLSAAFGFALAAVAAASGATAGEPVTTWHGNGQDHGGVVVTEVSLVQPFVAVRVTVGVLNMTDRPVDAEVRCNLYDRAGDAVAGTALELAGIAAGGRGRAVRWTIAPPVISAECWILTVAPLAE